MSRAFVCIDQGRAIDNGGHLIDKMLVPHCCSKRVGVSLFLSWKQTPPSNGNLVDGTKTFEAIERLVG